MVVVGWHGCWMRELYEDDGGRLPISLLRCGKSDTGALMLSSPGLYPLTERSIVLVSMTKSSLNTPQSPTASDEPETEAQRRTGHVLFGKLSIARCANISSAGCVGYWRSGGLRDKESCVRGQGHFDRQGSRSRPFSAPSSSLGV